MARFDDHHAYTADDTLDLVAAGRRHDVDAWLTTAKDHVKLARVWPADAPPLHVVDMVLEWPGEQTLAATVLSRLEA